MALAIAEGRRRAEVSPTGEQFLSPASTPPPAHSQASTMADRDRLTFDVAVAGAGAAGLTAALAAAESGAHVLLIERDPVPRGTTAMSTGLIPAAGTPEQEAAGIEDSPGLLVRDIMAKHGGQTDLAVVERLAAESAACAAWLQRHAVPLTLVTGFTYPGHSVMRMMGTPNRTGEELVAALAEAVARAGVTLLSRARVAALETGSDGRVAAIAIERPDGARETVGCRSLVLALGGFAGHAGRVAHFLPEMAGATMHGHPGCRGDWLDWAGLLGAALADMDSYQGHGGLAAGHAVPILWPSMTEGGIQVNALGHRFHDESRGYSEAAAAVNAQPDAVAWSIWDHRVHDVLLQFDDTRDALAAGAIMRADDVPRLAARTGLPEAALATTLAQAAAHTVAQTPCPFGRRFAARPPLAAPYFAARVTGALFHTQGGLVVDPAGRVLSRSGEPLPNLFAAGGCARGLSGPGASGYIAGNGLLAATGLGRLAGRAAAALAREQPA
jgi:fumarate reductase flavoprotein subunit